MIAVPSQEITHWQNGFWSMLEGVWDLLKIAYKDSDHMISWDGQEDVSPNNNEVGSTNIWH